MRAHGILTGRPVGAYPTWARVSMGTVEQMHRFADVMRTLYAERARAVGDASRG